MPTRGPSASDLTLLYAFAGAIFGLMVLSALWRGRSRTQYGRQGVALDWQGLRHLAETGSYDLREREAWDSPVAKATFSGIPPLKPRPKRKKRRRRRTDDLEAGGPSPRDPPRAGAPPPAPSASGVPRGAWTPASPRGWGPDQIAEEIRDHIGRLDAGAQATFRRRLGDARGDVDALADLNEAVQEAAGDYAQE